MSHRIDCMSRTYRQIPISSFRHPKTVGEKRQLIGIVEMLSGFVSKENRMRSRIHSRNLPCSFEDVAIAAWHEIPKHLY